MYSVAAASDLVTAPYPNHSGRSSIILWADASGTPVLATHRGCIGRVVETERLGSTCDVGDRGAFSAAIRAGLNRSWTPADRDRVTRYGQSRSVDNYRTLNAASVLSRVAPR